MNNNKSNIIRLILSLAGLFVATTNTASAEAYNPPCSAAYQIKETLENGATWDMCWEHRQREGIILKDIHYTPKGGDPVDDRRLILNHAAVAQIHVPYDDNGQRYHDISDYGIGGSNMLNLTSEECPSGDLLRFVRKNVICKQIETRNFAYKSANSSSKGTSLSLFSVSPVGAYYYIPTWRFMDDGTIEPWIGATGALQRFGSNESRGWKMGDDRVGIAHLHNFFWKLDFDLNNTANDDVVEELNFPLVNGKRVRQTTVFNRETARKVNPDSMRRWRIRDKNLSNSNGHSASYDIVLGDTGHQDIGPASEPFTHNDFYVTRQRTGEKFASHNPDGKKNLAEFIDGETINNNDLVVWAGVTFYHMPRSEDAPHMDAHWSHMQIIPRDWHASNPVADNLPGNSVPTLTTPSNQSTLAGVAVNLALQATDNDGDTLSYTATSLPAGLQINATTGVITGTATTIGSSNVSVSVSDGTDSATAQFTWLVRNNPPQITTPDHQIIQSGATVNLAIQATDPDAGDTLSFSATGLPAGLQINSTTGVISGVSTAVGNTNVTVTVTDGTNNATAQFAWSIRNNPPQITTPTNQTIRSGVTANLAIQATDTDVTDTLSFSATGLPAGLQINSTTGVITGVSTTVGSSNVTVTVTDGTGNAQAQFSWAITNNPPQITTPSNQSVQAGSAVNLAIQATDADSANTLTYSATGLPAGLQINSSTGVITGTPPTTTAAGTSAVTVTVSDGTDTATAQFNWVVTALPTNNPPQITNPNSQTGLVGSTVNLPIQATDSDPSDVLSYSATGLPAGLRINSSTGVITGSPTTAGTSTIVVTVSDSTDTATAQFNWVVTALPVNNPPQITNPNNQTGLVGSTVILAIQATDADPSDALNYSATGLPPGLQINNSTGVITGAPTTAGSSSVRVTVSDGTDTANVQFNWTVSALPVNNPPQITNPSNQAGLVGSLVNLAIQASDADAGDTLSYSAAGLPVGLQINTSNGVIAGTLSVAESTSVTVTVSDGTDNVSTQFSWIVSPVTVNSPPQVTTPANQVGPTGSVVNFNIQATDSNGDTLNYSATGLPAGLQINATTGVITGTLTTVNTYAVQVTVSDASSNTVATFNWDVTDPPSGGVMSNQVTSITPDGNLNDWVGVDYYANDPNDVSGNNNQIDWLKMAIAHSPEKVYFAYHNRNSIDPSNTAGSYIPWGWQAYLDTDNDPTTGYSIGSMGADFLIEGGVVQRYSGTGSSWSWQAAGNALVSYKGKNAELSFARSLIGNPVTMRVKFDGDNSAFGGTTTDSYPDSGNFEYTFTGASNPNNTPIADAQSVSVGTGASISVILSATDIDNDPLSYQVVQNPTHGSLSGSAPNLVYTADANYSGADSFTFKVNDGAVDSAVASVSITVTAGQNNGAISNFVSTPITIDGNASDWGSSIIRFADDANDIAANGVIDWKNVALAHDEQTLYLLYNNHNNIDPRRTRGSYMSWGWQVFIDTDKNSSTGYSAGGIGADYLIEGGYMHRYTGSGSNWSWQSTGRLATRYSGKVAELSLPRSLMSNTTSIRVAFVGDNLAYQGHGSSQDSYPDGFSNSQASTRYFDYDFAGGGGSNTRPVAYAQTVAVDAGTTANITLVATDAGSAPLTYSIAASPAHGTLTGTAPNLSYQPDTGFIGQDSFEFIVNNGSANSATVTVTLNVTGASNGVYSNLVGSIDVNGNNEEWASLTPFPEDPNDITGNRNIINWQQAAIAHNANTFYFMYKNHGVINPDNDSGSYINWGWQVYLDTDHDASTGYKVAGMGADFVLEGNQIQRYTGNGSTWSWDRINEGTMRYNANTAEMSFPRALLGNPDSLRVLFSGDNQSYGGDRTDNYPDTGYFKYHLSGGLQGTSARPSVSDEVLTTSGDSLTFSLSANDADNDQLTYRLIDEPSHGKLTNFDGSGKNIHYQAELGFEGTDSFRYVVNDGTYDSSIITVKINVTPPSESSSGGSLPLNWIMLLGLFALIRRHSHEK